jgi:Mg2+ and Co2+ transporter CorA
MIEYYRKQGSSGLKKISESGKNSWVKVVNPDDEEVDFLIEKFNLDRDSLLDGLDQNEVPRVEDEGKLVYIYLRIPTSVVANESTSSFLVLLSKDNIITISRHDLEIFEKVGNSRLFDTDNKERSLLQLLFYVFRAYSINVRRILKEVKSDRRNIRKLREKDIFDLVLQEDILNDYLSSFSPLIDMYNRILKIRSLKFKEEEKDFIEDLVVDLNQTFNTCRASLKTITNMRSYYSTTLTNDLNRVITVLTVFTIFLTIPTVISSIYGMNITLPLQNHPLIFLLLSGITILIWILVFIGFKKSKII